MVYYYDHANDISCQHSSVDYCAGKTHTSKISSSTLAKLQGDQVPEKDIDSATTSNNDKHMTVQIRLRHMTLIAKQKGVPIARQF